MATGSKGLVNGEGPRPCEYLILGEAPGADEEKQGRPFVGASGKLLDRALDAAGVGRENVYITNAYKYRPPGNRNPTEAELADHEPYLRAELESVVPNKVLALGSVAKSRTQHRFERRGEWTRSRHGRWLMWVWHPAYLLYSHDPSRLQDWLEQIRRFFDEVPHLRD